MTLSNAELYGSSTVKSVAPAGNFINTGSHKKAKSVDLTLLPENSSSFTLEDGTVLLRKHFEPHVIVEGLSQLGKTADGNKTAYLRLDLSGSDLSDTQPLAKYVHLQTISIPNNEIRTLFPLGKISNLTNLDVSHNKLTDVLGLDIKAGAISPLKFADLSHNNIRTVRLLTPFIKLCHLDLSSNQLVSPFGLGCLLSLQHLNLAYNKLANINALSTLTALQELNLKVRSAS